MAYSEIYIGRDNLTGQREALDDQISAESRERRRKLTNEEELAIQALGIREMIDIAIAQSEIAIAQSHVDAAPDNDSINSLTIGSTVIQFDKSVEEQKAEDVEARKSIERNGHVYKSKKQLLQDHEAHNSKVIPLADQPAHIRSRFGFDVTIFPQNARVVNWAAGNSSTMHQIPSVISGAGETQHDYQLCRVLLSDIAGDISQELRKRRRDRMTSHSPSTKHSYVKKINTGF